MDMPIASELPLTGIDVHTLPPADGEWVLRRQLAAAYRLVDHFGWTDTIDTHMTVRIPGEPKCFLINNYGDLFDEISPIKDFTGKVMELQFLDYEFGDPKYSEEECRTRDLTYSRPLWAKVELVNKETGAEVSRATSLTPGPAFTGTVREWYETLVETIIDVANQIHRKTLRGSANFIVVGPDVATIFESSILYKPSYTIDGDGQVGPMVIGAEKVGTLSNRFSVYKDPYFPRNKILVGYKGGSYLETGYVYAPYVPLIVTPTIFAPEDFTPRKGVMTRYGKKMVRNDFYGTVTTLDMNIV